MTRKIFLEHQPTILLQKNQKWVVGQKVQFKVFPMAGIWIHFSCLHLSRGKEIRKRGYQKRLYLLVDF